jgi:hypothetical protein
MSSETSEVRLYRFYNWEQNKGGEPFALCDECHPKQPVPSGCFLYLLANDAVIPCTKCERTNKLKASAG